MSFWVYRSGIMTKCWAFYSYGEPINVDAYSRELFNENLDPDEAAKSVMKKLNAEIERRLVGLTVNAQDWCVFSFVCSAIGVLKYAQGDAICCSYGHENTLGR